MINPAETPPDAHTPDLTITRWRPDSMPPTASLPQVSEEGVVKVHYWDDLGSGGVSSLTNLDAYPNNPDEVVSVNELRGPQNRADYYGSLVRGFIIPPSDGTYRFFVAGDDETEFWLSTDENPENIQMIGTVPGWTAPDQYSKYSSQASGTIELAEGSRYYFEIRHKELGGDDHFNVAWEGPGFSRQVIDADAIASLGKSHGTTSQQDLESAYTQGYRIGFFDGVHDLSVNTQYPPLDQDQDGLYDNWEIYHGLDPDAQADATSDTDGDLLNALDEFWLGTAPNNPDTDGDGIPDGVEFANELDPLDSSDAQQDLDGDGYTNLQEYQANTAMDYDADVPETEISRSSGFVGQYFLGKEFDQFVMARIDGEIDYEWGLGAPATGMPSDDFSIRWVGLFTAPHGSGQQEYRFQTVTDDGVRLYLENNLVIDEWRDQGSTSYEATTLLDAGETIAITIEYYERGQAATAKFNIVDPNTGAELNLMEVVSSPSPDLSTVDMQDYDNDGVPDTWEIAYGLNPWEPDSSTTKNSEDITTLEAYKNELHPWSLETLVNDETTEPLGPVSSTSGEVTLSWSLPSTRVDGTPLRSSDIRTFEVLYGKSPESLTNLHSVAIGETSTTIQELEPGVWYFSIRTIAETPGPLSEPLKHEVK